MTTPPPRPTLPRKHLGRADVDLTTVGLGCAWIGLQGDTLDEDLAYQTVVAALEAGVNLVDTAPLYPPGHSTASERAIGRGLRARPDLATGVRPGLSYIQRRFSPAVLAHVARLEAVCARHGVSLLAAALQFCVRHPLVAATIPGGRTPAEARANADAAREPIPPAVWDEFLPLVRTWSERERGAEWIELPPTPPTG